MRLGPTGEVYIAFDGQVTDNFPNNRPTNPYPWEFTRFPDTTEGLQLARFDLDVDGIAKPVQLRVHLQRVDGVRRDVSRSSDAIFACCRRARLWSETSSMSWVRPTPIVRGTITTFYRSGELLAQRSEYLVDPHAGGGDTFCSSHRIRLGDVYAAFQRLRSGSGPDLDVSVDQIAGVDPGANTPPAFSANDVTVSCRWYHDSGAFVSGFNYFYYDAEDGTIPSGGCCDRALGSFFLLGTTLVTCTFTDHGWAVRRRHIPVHVNTAAVRRRAVRRQHSQATRQHL